MPEPIVFKCEDSLWQMLADGSKTFDMRRWDLADDRICRLAWGRSEESDPARSRFGTPGSVRRPPDLLRRDAWIDGWWEPVEKDVSFVNKADGRIATFAYLGMEFARWAPGWCFLLLGRRMG